MTMPSSSVALPATCEPFTRNDPCAVAIPIAAGVAQRTTPIAETNKANFVAREIMSLRLLWALVQNTARWHISARWVVSLCVLPFLGICTYRSIGFAAADLQYRKGTAEGVSTAARLNPLQAKYWSWLGELQELQGQDPVPAWNRAIALNPADSGTCIRLGLRAETSGDLDTAAQMLLRAASVDHQFEPKATLANFYFRREQPEPFWQWVREAVSMDYGDARPLFQLCWQMSSDATEIQHRCVPDNDRAYRKYLGYLIAQGNVDAAAPVFAKLGIVSDDAEMLLGYCDVLLAAGRGPEARSVWNTLAGPQTEVLVNGNFEKDPRRIAPRAFAWRLSPSEALDYSLLDAPRALGIEFNGKQSESLEVLSQTFVVDPGKRYKLSYTYRTSGVKPTSGLRWRMIAGERFESPGLSATEWKTDSLAFTATLKSVAALSLVCERPLGETRIRGGIALREVQIEPEP